MYICITLLWIPRASGSGSGDIKKLDVIFCVAGGGNRLTVCCGGLFGKE